MNIYLLAACGAVPPLEPELAVLPVPLVDVQREPEGVRAAAGHLVPEDGLDVRHVSVHQDPRRRSHLYRRCFVSTFGRANDTKTTMW